MALRRSVAAVAAAALVATVIAVPAHGRPDSDTGLAAEFKGLPDNHDGTEFSFELSFTLQPSISFVTLRDHALSVSGGSITAISRIDRSRNDRWNLTVTPGPGHTGDIVITLAATESCTDKHAICTTNDVPLARSVISIIRGPQTPEREDTGILAKRAEPGRAEPNWAEASAAEPDPLVVWSGSVSVAADDYRGNPVLGFSTFRSSGAVDPREFSYGGLNGLVDFVAYVPALDQLWFGAAPRPGTANGLALAIDGSEFAFADATERKSATWAYTWDNASDVAAIDWEVGDTVEMSVVAPDLQRSQLHSLGMVGVTEVGFDAGQHHYRTEVWPDVETVTVSPQGDVNAEMEILTARSDGSFAFDAADARPRQPGHQARLSSAGGDTIVAVLTDDGAAQDAYIVHLSQPGSSTSMRGVSGKVDVSLETSQSDATLETLMLAGAALDSAFDPGTTEHAATASAGVTRVTVTAAPTAAGAQVAITPADADPLTEGHQIDLRVPEPGRGPTRTTVVIAVRTANTGTVAAYTVNIASGAAPAAPADTSVPVVSISGPEGVQTGPFKVTFSWSEPVTGFSAEDIKVAAGTLSGFAPDPADPLVWTATLTPPDEVRRNIAVTVFAGAATDGTNINSWTRHRFQINTSRPDVSLQITPLESASPGYVTGRFWVQPKFSEPVTGWKRGDLEVDNGRIASYNRQLRLALVEPTNEGPVTVSVAPGAAQDDDGNPNTATSITVIYDATPPTVGLSSPSATAVPGPFEAAIVFSEPVTGLDIDDIESTNASLSNLNGDGSEYRVTVTPAGHGRIVVKVPENAAQDAAGHRSRASTTLTRFRVIAPTAPRDLALTPGDNRITVQWQPPASDPGNQVGGYRVEWKPSTQQWDAVSAAAVPTRGRTHTAGGLDAGTAYDVRVAATYGEVTGPWAHATATPTDGGTPIAYTDPIEPDPTEPGTGPGSAREYIETNIVERLEAVFPWLRQVWNLDYPIGIENRLGLNVIATFHRTPSSAGDFRGLERGTSIDFVPSASTDKVTVVHELAHGLTIDHRAPTTPGPIGVSWLYAVHRSRGCYRPWEILADLITQRTTGEIFTYLQGCASLLDGGKLDAHAQETIDRVLEGQIPQWFYDHYQGDEPAPDLDSVWSDIRNRSPWEWRSTVAYHWRNLFGGFCSLHEASSAATKTGGLSEGNPWVDGGCVRRRPQQLSLSATSGGLTVSWRRPLYQTTPTITHYVVQWRTDDQQFGTDRQAVVPAENRQTSHQITGLVDGTQYFVRVAAVNADALSVIADDDGHSRVAEAAAVAGGPAAPGDVAAISANAQATLSWSAPAEDGPAVTGFVVAWKSGTESYDAARQLVLDASARSATVADLVNGTDYTLRVSAMAGPVAGTGTETTVTIGLPAAPGGIRLLGGEASVQASWEAPSGNGSDITGYVVQWRFGGDRFSSSRETVVEDPATLSLTIEGLVGGQRYEVRVMALNAHGRGEPSTPQTAAAAEPVDTRAPTMNITGPQGTQNGPFTVAFTWSEWVADFTADDIIVSKGNLTELSQSADWLTWTATVTPPDDFQGTMTIVVRAGAATDGNNRSHSISHDVKADTSV